MTDRDIDAHHAVTDTRPTGPIGRLARLVLVGVWSAALLSFVDQDGAVGFRDPAVAAELTVWILTAGMLAAFAALVGAIASGAGRQPVRCWQVGASIMLAMLAVGAAIAGQAAFGSVWGFPLADLVWWFDMLMLVETIIASLIAIAIGTPGCEVGVWPALLARARGGSAATVAGPACIVGLHFIDHWEAARRGRAEIELLSGQ